MYVPHQLPEFRLSDGVATPKRRAVKDAEERRERKRAEMELRESEERLTRAQQVAHFGCWDWNIVAGSLYWTEGIYREQAAREARRSAGRAGEILQVR